MKTNSWTKMHRWGLAAVAFAAACSNEGPAGAPGETGPRVPRAGLGPADRKGCSRCPPPISP